MPDYKIVVLGSGGVGKSALVGREGGVACVCVRCDVLRGARVRSVVWRVLWRWCKCRTVHTYYLYTLVWFVFGVFSHVRYPLALLRL
jgi:hypothetical protein